VSIVENCISDENIHVVMSIGNIRAFVITLAIIVMEKLLFVGMKKTGSCSVVQNKLKEGRFIGVHNVVCGVCVAF